jgi:mRNA-degrading endonuclease toxin of MazEF toxin-antitoxin module
MLFPSQPPRTKHERRPVLIVQTDEDNRDVFYPCLLVAPLSSRTDLKSNKDYKLKANQAGLAKESIVHLGLIQPVLKTDLGGEAVGKLDSLTSTDVDAILAANLGLIDRT